MVVLKSPPRKKRQQKVCNMYVQDHNMYIVYYSIIQPCLSATFVHGVLYHTGKILRIGAHEKATKDQRTTERI